MSGPSLTTVALSAAAVGAAREVWLQVAFVHRARRLLATGSPGPAAELWARWLGLPKLLGDRRKGRFELAHCLYRAGRWAEALDECHRLEESGPGPALLGPVRQLAADCLTRLGRADEAAATRTAATQAFATAQPASLYASELEVDHLEAQGQWFAALRRLDDLCEALTRALPLGGIGAPSWEYALALRLRLGRAQFRLGYYEAAMATAETVLGRVGLPVELQHEAHLLAGRAYLELEALPQAQRDAEAAFRVANRAADRDRLIEDCLLLAEIALHRGDFVEAMRQYQRVRECAGAGRWLAAVGEAELLELWGRGAEATAALDHAARLAQATGDPRAPALVGLSAASLAAERPTAAWALLAPTLNVDLDDPRLDIRRAALAASLAPAVGGDPERFAGLLASARTDFAHDRHLLAELDAADAARAEALGDGATAAACLRAALGRPCHRLLAPGLHVRLARVLAAEGDAAGAAAAWAAAAACPVPLGSVVQARAWLAATRPAPPGSSRGAPPATPA